MEYNCVEKTVMFRLVTPLHLLESVQVPKATRDPSQSGEITPLIRPEQPPDWDDQLEFMVNKVKREKILLNRG